MVAYAYGHKQHGNGIIDNILSKFTYSRYPGEHHAISLAPSTFGHPMSFMGPNTNLNLRLRDDLTPKDNSLPINKSDYASMEHDIEYMQAKKNYDANPTKENKKVQIKKVWDADNKFINEMNLDKEEPMASIAGRLISTKKNLEQMHILPTTVFEGFGEKSDGLLSQPRASDPTARLKALVEEKYLTESKQHKIKSKQEGGLIPLAAIALPALGALAGKVLVDIYSAIKKKITGGGYKIPYHKSNKDKKEFLIQLLQNI